MSEIGESPVAPHADSEAMESADQLVAISEWMSLR